MAKNICLLRIQHLRYSVPSRTQKILNLNSLSIDAGKCYFVLGENGAGKSSLLSVMGGQLEPDSGEIFWKGNRLKPLSERLVKGFEGIGMVKQEPEFNPFLNVEEELYKSLRHLADRELIKKRNELIILCHLKSLLSQKVGNLSGGEKRRLAIALALGGNAELLLLDEPFSDLDYPNKALLRGVLLELKQIHNTALVIVSHHGEDANWLADEIRTMEKGRWVETVGRTKSGFNPQSVRTARLTGWKNLLPLHLLADTFAELKESGFSWFHIPINFIHLTPGKETEIIGSGLVIGCHFQNGMWHILLKIKEVWLEVEDPKAPVSAHVSVYVTAAQLIGFKD